MLSQSHGVADTGVQSTRSYDVLGRLVTVVAAATAPTGVTAAPAQTDYTLDAGGRVTDGERRHKSIQCDAPATAEAGCYSDGCPKLLLLVLRTFVAAIRSRRDLAVENLILRHQLQVALRTNPHPRLRAPDRFLWVWLRRLWPEGWRQHLRVVQPETVHRWHRKGWRLYWTWKSRTQLGCPHLRAEVRELVARISHENPRWGPNASGVSC